MKMQCKYLASISFLLFILLLPGISGAQPDKPGGDVASIVAEPETIPTICDGICVSSATPTLVVCAIYFLLLLLARFTWIVLPNNQYLRIYAEEVKAQLVIEQDNPAVQTKVEETIKPAIEKLLDDVLTLIPYINWKNWHCWLLAGTGKQLACWRNVHKAKVFAIDLLSDNDARALAIVVNQTLASHSSKEGKGLSKEITKALDAGSDIQMIKSLAKHGQEFLFDDRDSYFQGLASWQNRATWLVMVSLLTVVVLGLTHGNTALFVLGAVGGLLSRMRKALSRKDYAFDYGASWSTLFLAPVVGALTGWVGVLLVFVLTEAHLLGSVFETILNISVIRGVPWSDLPITKEAMALAVAFGFSATFFERIMERMENSADNAPEAKENDKGVIK